MGQAGLERPPRGGEVREQLGREEPSLEGSLSHGEEEEEGDRQDEPVEGGGDNDKVEGGQLSGNFWSRFVEVVWEEVMEVGKEKSENSGSR